MAVDADLEAVRATRVGRTLHAAAANPGLVLAGILLALVLLAVLWPDLLAPGDPLRSQPEVRLQSPSFAHVFGTDELGRDLYTRVVHGASLSIRSTALAVLIGLVLGSLIGAVAGYAGGVVDHVLMRFVDVILAIPGLLLSLAMIAALGPGTTQVAIAVGAGSIPAFARVVRAETLRVRSADYVEASHALGSGGGRTFFRHVLPNVAGQALVLATVTFATAILAVAALSFLGFGAAPPAPEWGNLVSEGRDYLATAWWLTVLPAAVVVATVLSVNRVARAFERRGDRLVR